MKKAFEYRVLVCCIMLKYFERMILLRHVSCMQSLRAWFVLAKKNMKSWSKGGLELTKLRIPTLRTWFFVGILAMNVRFGANLEDALSQLWWNFSFHRCYKIRSLDLDATGILKGLLKTNISLTKSCTMTCTLLVCHEDWYMSSIWGMQQPCNIS